MVWPSANSMGRQHAFGQTSTRATGFPGATIHGMSRRSAMRRPSPSRSLKRTPYAWCRCLAVSAAFGLACRGGDSGERADRDTVQAHETARATASGSDTLAAGAFRALGTEPFWNLEIRSEGLRFITPDDTVGMRFPPITPTMVGDTTRWVGETERAPIDVRIWPARCSDGMSDRVWALTAVMTINQTVYRGCAERLAR